MAETAQKQPGSGEGTPVASQPRVVEGNLVVPPGARFALVASRFNHFIVDRLVEGAVDAIVRHGGAAGRVTIVRVPGAWEIPSAVARLARKGQVDAIVALGAVIRGSTPHFDYVAAEATKGIAQAGMQSGLPVVFGVVTADTVEQAMDRAGVKAGNKGFEAAMSAVELVNLYRDAFNDKAGGGRRKGK